jgi:hypothetical protein
MSPRRIAAGILTAAGIAVMAAAPASAGEVNGNGGDLPLKGASLCKYSGLNDEITEEEPTRTQSYGTFFVLIRNATGMSTKEFKDAGILPSPGLACNPTVEFEE